MLIIVLYTHGHDAEVNYVPKHVEIIPSEVKHFVYFLHCVVDDEPQDDHHAGQLPQRVGHDKPVQLDGPKRSRRKYATGCRKLEH